MRYGAAEEVVATIVSYRLDKGICIHKEYTNISYKEKEREEPT